MQDEMRRLINLCEGLAESGDPVVAGKLNGRKIDLPSGVTVTLYDPDNSETDHENQPMVEYKIASDGEPTSYTAVYYAADKSWFIFDDGADPEVGELSGQRLSDLLAEVPDFAEYEQEQDDGYSWDDHPSLTAAERNR